VDSLSEHCSREGASATNCDNIKNPINHDGELLQGLDPNLK